MIRFLSAALVCVVTATTITAQRGWPSEGPPRPLATRAVTFPAYELRTLPNGLQVVAVLHHEQPAVSIRMFVRAGSALDPAGKLGLASLTAALLDQGTTRSSATEMNDAIDFMGAEVDAGAGTDLSFINIVVMKDSFEAGLGILSDMARKPAFAEAEIERQRQKMRSSMEVNFEDPAYLANAVFDRLVYGFHPYGLPDTGTPDTISAISQDDIVAFHNRNFVPNNAILAVVGDVTAEEAFNGVARVFGDWQRREVPKSIFIAPPDPTRRVIVVNKPDAVQTEIRVGQIGVRRNHSDYMSLNLAIRILGGEGANRLHQVLRTERGLTYGAEADMNALLEAGNFEAETSTRSDATAEALRLVVEEFWRLQRDRVSDRELSDAKAYMTGSFPLTIETPDAIAMQVLNVVFYGLPIEHLQSYRERVNAVTPDEVQRVARSYLRPDRLSIVLVGNASAFQSQLKSAGFGTFETINVEDLDLTAVSFKKPPRSGERQLGEGTRTMGAMGNADAATARGPAYQAQSGVQPRSPIAAGEGAKARALLDKVIQAKGSFETLRGIKSITAVSRSESQTPKGPVDTQTTTYLQYPNRVRVETKLPDTTIVQVYDGSHGWVRSPSGVHAVPDRMLHDMETSFRRDTVALLLAAHDGTVRTRILPDVKDDSGRLHLALELSGIELDPMVLLIDPQTGLIDKQTYVTPGTGQPLIEEVFSDYRNVNGVQIAFTAEVRQNGRRVLDRHVTDIKINEPLDSSLFKRPEP